MPKPVNIPNLVSWQDLPDGGAVRGIITEYVKQPFYIDISSRAEWVLYSVDKQDKQCFVDRGQTGNVVTAKADATRAALSKVSELKAATTQTTGEAVQVRMLESLPISGRRATVRLYSFLAALILWAFWLFYLWLRVQPWRATLTLAILAAGLWLAHITLKAIDSLNSRRERITKRKQLAEAKRVIQHSPQRALVGRS